MQVLLIFIRYFICIIASLDGHEQVVSDIIDEKITKSHNVFEGSVCRCVQYWSSHVCVRSARLVLLNSPSFVIFW